MKNWIPVARVAAVAGSVLLAGGYITFVSCKGSGGGTPAAKSEPAAGQVNADASPAKPEAAPDRFYMETTKSAGGAITPPPKPSAEPSSKQNAEQPKQKKEYLPTSKSASGTPYSGE